MKNKSIQGLRAVAFVLVFLSHLNVPHFEGGGVFGVSLFFILSGFLMVYSYQKKHISQNAIMFGIIKISKIYWLHLLTLMLVIPFSVKVYFVDHTYSLTNFILSSLANLFLLQSWVPDTSFYFSLNGVSWYLSTTLFLYASFPLIKKILDNHKIKRIPCIVKLPVTVLIATLIDFAFFYSAEPISIWGRYICPFTRIFDFIIGCLLGDFFIHSRSNKEDVDCVKYKMCVCGGGIGIFILDVLCLEIYSIHFNTNQNNFWWGSTVMWFIPSLITIAYTYKQKGLLCSILSSKIFVHLGNLSPYLYLLHQVVIRYFQAFEKHILNNCSLSNTIVGVGSAVLSVLFSELLYRLVLRKDNLKLRFKNMRVFR